MLAGDQTRDHRQVSFEDSPMQRKMFPLRAVQRLATAIKEKLSGKVGDHHRGLIRMENMLDLLRQSLCLRLACLLLLSIDIYTSKELNGVPNFVHYTAGQSCLFCQSNRVIVTNLTKYFRAKHLSEDVEKLLFCS